MSDSPILNQVLVMVPAKQAIEGVIELRSLRTDRAIRRRAACRFLVITCSPDGDDPPSRSHAAFSSL